MSLTALSFYVITAACVGGVVMPKLSVSVLGILSWLAFQFALCLQLPEPVSDTLM